MRTALAEAERRNAELDDANTDLREYIEELERLAMESGDDLQARVVQLTGQLETMRVSRDQWMAKFSAEVAHRKAVEKELRAFERQQGVIQEGAGPGEPRKRTVQMKMELEECESRVRGPLGAGRRPATAPRMKRHGSGTPTTDGDPRSVSH